MTRGNTRRRRIAKAARKARAKWRFHDPESPGACMRRKLFAEALDTPWPFTTYKRPAVLYECYEREPPRLYRLLKTDADSVTLGP